MTIITLITDYGAGAPEVSQMTGVVWRVAPGAKMVDLTHMIPPGDVLAAQVVLENAIPYFPEGTIHCVLVGVKAAGDARPLAARTGSMLFVGPDTGLLTPLLERAETNRQQVEVLHALNTRYWHASGLQFPGRADYASIAAHLAAGVPLAALGEQINDPKRISIPAPEMLADGWRGQVVQSDHFGNLVINIRRAHLEGMGPVQVTISGRLINGISATFGDGKPGDLVALMDSSNRLSICVVNGSAAERLSAHPGEPVEVHTVRKA